MGFYGVGWFLVVCLFVYVGSWCVVMCLVVWCGGGGVIGLFCVML